MSNDELYRDALEVLILAAIVAKDARQDTEQRLKRFGAEITAPQYRVLRQLQQQSSATIKELSRSLMVEPATLVPMVDTLERHGFLRRGHDPRDRRRTPLELTETGRERLGQIPFVHEDDPIAKYLRQLPENERHDFLRHLRDLVATLHGHDQAVRAIGDAVTQYFAFGALHEGTHDRPTKPPQPADQEEPTT